MATMGNCAVGCATRLGCWGMVVAVIVIRVKNKCVLYCCKCTECLLLKENEAVQPADLGWLRCCAPFRHPLSCMTSPRNSAFDVHTPLRTRLRAQNDLTCLCDLNAPLPHLNATPSCAARGKWWPRVMRELKRSLPVIPQAIPTSGEPSKCYTASLNPSNPLALSHSQRPTLFRDPSVPADAS